MAVEATDDIEKAFAARGFLAPEVTADVTGRVRMANRDWFKLCEDISDCLQRTTFKNMTLAQGALSFAPETVAELFAIRAAGTLQGAIIMAERGMAVEARSLVRSLLEDAFCLAALHERPVEFLAMIEADDSAARKGQAKAILKNNLASDPDSQKRLLAFLDGLPKKVQMLGMETVADLGPLNIQYLMYRMLSNDAVHPSATSLRRHMNFNPERTAWIGFIVGPATFKEIAETLDYAAIAANAVGIALTGIFKDADSNSEFAELSKRYQVLSAHRAATEGP